MTAILPLFIIVVIIAIFRFNWGMKRGTSSYIKRIRMIVSCYLAILVICAGLDVVHPAEGRYVAKKVDGGKVIQESFELYDTAVNRGIDAIDPKFFVKKWDFDYQGSVLKVESTGRDFYSLYLVVDRKTVNDGKIEASYFRSRSSIGDMELTSHLVSPEVKLGGNHLTIVPPEKIKMTYYQFANVFSIKQFTGETNQTMSNYNEGQLILYLQVPKDLKLDIPENGFSWRELGQE